MDHQPKELPSTILSQAFFDWIFSPVRALRLQTPSNKVLCLTDELKLTRPKKMDLGCGNGWKKQRKFQAAEAPRIGLACQG